MAFTLDTVFSELLLNLTARRLLPRYSTTFPIRPRLIFDQNNLETTSGRQEK